MLTYLFGVTIQPTKQGKTRQLEAGDLGVILNPAAYYKSLVLVPHSEELHRRAAGSSDQSAEPFVNRL